MSINAQVVQYGKVIDTDTHGKTLVGVAISVPSAHDSQPTASDSRGEFRLIFSEHEAGDVIHGLRVRKNGYEVVNIHVTRDGWTLTDRDTLRIVMAPIGRLTEARMKYYDLLETACVARYDATINYLDDQLAQQQVSSFEYQYWKQRADDELNEFYSIMDEQADQLARFSLENDTEVSLASIADTSTPSVLDELQGTMAITPSMFDGEYKASVFSVDDALPFYGAQYADACYGLALMFEQQHQPAEATKYLLQALRMFETLQTLGYDYSLEIGNIKAKLYDQ